MIGAALIADRATGARAGETPTGTAREADEDMAMAAIVLYYQQSVALGDRQKGDGNEDQVGRKEGSKIGI